MEPGMHVSSIKLPEIGDAALEKADRVGLHFAHQSPITVIAKDAKPSDHAAGRGWTSHQGFDYNACPRLPEMLAGDVQGRESPDETTIFINDLGLGLQFAAVGGLVYRKAKAAGIGNELPTDWFTEDVHP